MTRAPFYVQCFSNWSNSHQQMYDCLLRQMKTNCDITMEIYCDITCCMDTKHIMVLMCRHHVGNRVKQLFWYYIGKHRGSKGSNAPQPLVCSSTKGFPNSWIFLFWHGAGGKMSFHGCFRINHCVTRIRQPHKKN